MERHPKTYEKILFGNRDGIMNIEKNYDKKKVEYIAKNCGSESVKKSFSYLDKMQYYNPSKFVCVIVDDCAFFAGTICKKHFRLIELAVCEENHKKGYGRKLIGIMRQLCKQKGLEKITFRTSRKEDALYFYEKMGAKIVKMKEEDFEMEIILKGAS